MRTTTLPPDAVLADRADPLFSIDRHSTDELHDELRELGFSAGELEEIETIIERHARGVAFRLAAGFLHEIMERLSTHRQGAVLRDALGLATESLSDVGARFGVSKQAIEQASSRLQHMLGGITVKAPKPPAAVLPPDDTGRWERRCVAQRRWAGTEAAIRAGRLPMTKAEHGGAWVLRSDVDRLRDAELLQQAQERLPFNRPTVDAVASSNNANS